MKYSDLEPLAKSNIELNRIEGSNMELVNNNTNADFYFSDLSNWSTIDDKVKVDYVLDWGAECNLLDFRMAEAAGLKLKLLERPLKLKLAVKTQEIRTILYSATVSKLVVRTMEGPLILANIEFLVCEEVIEELLIGKPLLKSLGIDLDRQVALLVRRQRDATVRAKRTGLREYCPSEVHERQKENPNNPGRILEIFDKKLEQARKKGLSFKYSRKIRKLLIRYINNFALELDETSGANVPPYEIELKENENIARCAPRRYSSLQSQFLEYKFGKMIKAGFAKELRGARSCSPALIQNKVLAPSDFTTDFRLTSDFRRINANTVPLNFPLINMELVSRWVAGSKYYQKYDLTDFFTQLKTTERTAEILSVMTDKGVFAFDRLQQGSTNAAPFAQMAINEVFADKIMREVIAYIDDLLTHSATVEGLYNNMVYIMDTCEKFNLKLHPEKMELFATEIEYLGQTFNEHGVKPSYSRIKDLIEVAEPTNAGELQSWLAATNWIRDNIYDYSRLALPLTSKLKNLLEGTKRTNKIAQGIAITFTREERECFMEMKKRIGEATLRAHPNEEYDMVLMTDASSIGYGAVLFMVKDYDSSLPIGTQPMIPLAFLSGTFTKNQVNWSIVEKESYSIVKSVEKWEYLLQREKPYYIITDHLNLKYIFNPESGAKLATSHRLRRWQACLMSQRYYIKHVKGEENVLADLLSRWALPAYQEIRVKRAVTRSMAIQRDEQDDSKDPSDPAVPPTIEEGVEDKADSETETEAETATETETETTETETENQSTGSGTNKKKKRKRKFVRVPLHPYDGEHKINPPSLQEILISQRINGDEQREDLVDSRGTIKRQGKYWIPETDKGLIMRMIMTTHCGPSIHRGVGSTLKKLKRYVNWKGMDEEVRNFISSCLLCAQTKGGQIVHRPFGTSKSASTVNEVIHFDFLYLEESEEGYEWVLVIKDELSGYIEIFPTYAITAEFTASALIDWFSRNGIPKKLVSDNGSHFKNELMKKLSDFYKLQHHFVTPLIHFSNGTIERINRDILAALRIVLREYDVKNSYWPSMIKLVQFGINHGPTTELAGYTPFEAFTGKKSEDNLAAIFIGQDLVEVRPTTEEFGNSIEELRESLDDMHHNIRKIKQQRHMENIKYQKAAKPIDFGIGSYVLWSKIDKQMPGDKLGVRWTGPYRVVEVVSNYVYRIEHMVTQKISCVHASRLKFYTDEQLELTEELEKHFGNQGFVLDIEVLNNIQYNLEIEDFEIEVKWKGFEQMEATKEPFLHLWEQVPVMMTELLRDVKKTQPELVAQVCTKHATIMKQTASKKKFVKLTGLVE